MTVKRHVTVDDFQSLQTILPRYKTTKAAKKGGIIKGQAFILEAVDIKAETLDLIVVMR
jgi:hypothetical protein